ncbi:DNA recombination and repair protein RecF [Prochlorococcus sp. SS52]|uniref:DNA replication and repair protein RecF n=1 Tax=Prochlorococcus marinus (strain SARG / CCMP1375 / SS120) TaxID=167539 RepID=Q7V9U6_PROMA|nr:Recombinational DNA repair ATPase (RecF pathway) [Prochlorococcus marinus subsp. marinus str. CCMP1375]KGG10733.1 DNA recombination and repair protein RecF [Prochlorococcus marinus str. LG]KGG21155.1 DNA recombination and repair protein RecF [Prochlorococcus marinus str. SS2]KGG23979.1 DNA recombination and repair protein RecF [Prochlorococcus marinus str. SS35]KGG31761.1 DNA recombination and repair protein RecF [Prochlorococcus marinus str. SS51]KGG34828.1 DNA recombination and repair pro
MKLTEKRLLVIGPNGAGKSNLLEAVELLGSLRSHRSSSDQDLIHWGASEAVVRAITSDEEKLQLEFRKLGGRKASRNGKSLARQLDLLGSLRCVGFSALDLSLVRGEPLLRRNWLDRVVQQLEPVYGDLITRFNRLLRQRNQLWRQWKDRSKDEHYALLDAFDSQMALVSTRIHRRRIRALKHLGPIAATWQKRLSKGKEDLELKYHPGSILEGEEEELAWRLTIEKQLAEQRNEEERLGICKVGPHRDEVLFLLNGVPARKFGSAGQQRTLVLALKLAELEFVGEMYKDPPILLLDDVFAELDPIRQLLLLEAVGDNHQCLISATHLDAFEGDWRKNSQILELALQQDGILEVG